VLVRRLGGVLLVLGLAARTLSLVPAWTSDGVVWARAVAIDPVSAESWINLGNARLKAEDRPGALVAFIRARREAHHSRYPAYVHIVAGLNIALTQGMEGQWQQASRSLAVIPVKRPWPGSFEARAQRIESVIQASVSPSSSSS
jgi:hypothetical protein